MEVKHATRAKSLNNFDGIHRAAPPKNPVVNLATLPDRLS